MLVSHPRKRNNEKNGTCINFISDSTSKPMRPKFSSWWVLETILSEGTMWINSSTVLKLFSITLIQILICRLHSTLEFPQLYINSIVILTLCTTKKSSIRIRRNSFGGKGIPKFPMLSAVVIVFVVTEILLGWCSAILVRVLHLPRIFLSVLLTLHSYPWNRNSNAHKHAIRFSPSRLQIPHFEWSGLLLLWR